MRRAIFLLVCLFATTFLSTTFTEAAPESDSAQVNDEEFKQIRDQYNHCSMGQRRETIALIDALLSKIKHTDSKESLEQTISLFEMKILLYRSLRDWDSRDKAILTLTELIKLKEINSNDGKAAASDYDSLAGMLTEKIYHFDGLYNGCVQTRKEKEISKERANKAKAELHKLCKKMLAKNYSLGNPGLLCNLCLVTSSVELLLKYSDRPGQLLVEAEALWAAESGNRNKISSDWGGGVVLCVNPNRQIPQPVLDSWNQRVAREFDVYANSPKSQDDDENLVNSAGRLLIWPERADCNNLDFDLILATANYPRPLVYPSPDQKKQLDNNILTLFDIPENMRRVKSVLAPSF